MPFSRPPLSYEINQLIVSVGLAREIWLREIVVPNEDDRPEAEARAASFLGLDKAIEDGLIKSYHFYWTRSGIIKRIRLVPTAKVRRTPGVARFKEIFLRE